MNSYQNRIWSWNKIHPCNQAKSDASMHSKQGTSHSQWSLAIYVYNLMVDSLSFGSLLAYTYQ